jgi:hypothetical protein
MALNEYFEGILNEKWSFATILVWTELINCGSMHG